VGEGSRRREYAHEWVGGPLLKNESVKDSLVLKRIEKISCSRFRSAWTVFSNQADKQSYSN
jgi:hypothetical protein